MLDVCDPRVIRALLEKYGFHFSKAKGQNFLTQRWVPQRIAQEAGIDCSTGVLEIGPGFGPLTQELCLRAGRVTAIELDTTLRPVFDFIRNIPPIAWIPIMIILLGIGVVAKAAIVFLSAFIPCVVNSYTGIKSVKKVHIWVGQTFGASKLRILFKVAIPSALPHIFTGLKVSLNSSWGCLVAAEMLGSDSGLGYMIQIGRLLCRADIIIVGMIVIGVCGTILSALLDLLERALVKGDV